MPTAKNNRLKPNGELKGQLEVAHEHLRPNALLASIREVHGSAGEYYRFGINDNVPNQLIESINDSGTARQCVDRLNQFVWGYGFKREEMKLLKVNPKENLEDFSRKCIEYLNYTEGFVIQHKFDMAGRSVQKYVVPLQYVRRRLSGDFIYREGLGDEIGTFKYHMNDIVVPNWETVKLMSPAEIRQMLKSQVERYGVQMGAFQYVYIPRIGQLYDKYPVPAWFSGLHDLRADAGLSLTEESIVANSFKAQVIVTGPRLDRNEQDEDGLTEYDRMVNEMNRFTSPDGSSVMYLEINNDEAKQVQVTAISGKDRMNETEAATVRIAKKIARHFGVPPIIIGIDTAGKLGDNQELVNKFKLFNLTLEDKRRLYYKGMVDAFVQEGLVYEDFELEQLDLFDYLPDKVLERLSDAEIREMYGIPQVEAEAIESPTPSGESSTNNVLRQLSGREQQNLERIVRKYVQGVYTLEQAKMMLMEGFALTDEQATLFLPEDSVELRNKALKNETYSDYGSGVRGNARRALEYAEKNGWGGCGTPVGKERANQLASGEKISVATIKRMYSYLSRAAEDYDGGSLEKCGNLMYLAWGGKAGLAWSRSKLRELGEIDE